MWDDAHASHAPSLARTATIEADLAGIAIRGGGFETSATGWPALAGAVERRWVGQAEFGRGQRDVVSVSRSLSYSAGGSTTSEMTSFIFSSAAEADAGFGPQVRPEQAGENDDEDESGPPCGPCRGGGFAARRQSASFMPKTGLGEQVDHRHAEVHQQHGEGDPSG